MPSTPYDAKGLLVACIEDDNPVVYIDDRWLYNYKGGVPEELYSIQIGKGKVRRRGEDVTIVATSYMVHEAGGWKTCGIGAEISARIAESDIFKQLKAPISRVSLPDTPAPASYALENVYYKKAEDIVVAVKELMEDDNV
jgi:pyruvate dehydrogenase E1 component beta subunit